MQKLNSFSITPLSGDLELRMCLAKQIARHIAFEIPPLYEENDRTKAWTVAIRSVLRKMLPEGWHMFPPFDHTNSGEFLVDACWWVDRQGAALVAEFEWLAKWEEILKDFDKIAVIKAPFNLLIHHASRGQRTSDSIRQHLTDYLAHYEHHLRGETYIFIEYWPSDYVRAFIWQAPQSGRVSPIEFFDCCGPEHFKRKFMTART